jgi:hypothetical protein
MTSLGWGVTFKSKKIPVPGDCSPPQRFLAVRRLDLLQSGAPLILSVGSLGLGIR